MLCIVCLCRIITVEPCQTVRELKKKLAKFNTESTLARFAFLNRFQKPTFLRAKLLHWPNTNSVYLIPQLSPYSLSKQSERNSKLHLRNM